MFQYLQNNLSSSTIRGLARDELVDRQLDARRIASDPMRCQTNNIALHVKTKNAERSMVVSFLTFINYLYNYLSLCITILYNNNNNNVYTNIINVYTNIIICAR